MYLKKLEMQGFKSFVDKVNVDFVNGITAVVGPNGSGKSNISDGIRWVMGEQSAKSLRGAKMEDVIFAGTEKRKPTGFAEVTLTLDNSSHIFSVDYDEIAVTRRVFRSGDSEYLINKTPCRLKDIHELFMDTGLGRDGYSIIGQGKIDEILSAKSEDRRQIFEEAAGVSKYKYRKVEAERKLDSTEENLVRIRDIITELEGQVEPLRLQSEKAKRYLSLRDELKELAINLFLVRIEKGKSLLQELEEKHRLAMSDLTQAKEKLTSIEQKTEEIYDGLREKDETTQLYREALHEAELLNAKLESEIQIIQNNIKNAEETVRRLTSGGNGGQRKDQELLSAIDEAENATQNVLRKRDEMLITAEATENESAALRDRSIELGSKIEETRNRITELQRAEADTKNKLENSETLAENYRREREAREQEQVALKRKISDMEARIQEIKNSLEIAEHEYSKKRTEWNRTIAEQKEIGEDVTRKKEEYNELSAIWNQQESRLRALQEMEHNMEGYSKSVKALLSAKDGGELSHVGLVGVVSKLLDAPGEYMTAVEVALASSAQNLVVHTEEDAKAAIRYLKAQHLGRATFLPISSVNGKPLEESKKILRHDGVIGIASELVSFDESLRGVMEFLLGRVVVVENIDVATALAKEFRQSLKIVTLEGELITPGGAISGGSRGRGGSIFGREKEIEELKSASKSLEKKLSKIDDVIDSLIEKQNDCSARITELRNELADAESKTVKTEGSLHLQEQLLDTLNHNLEQSRNEIDEIDESIRKLTMEKADFGVKTEDILKESEEAEEALSKAQQEFRALAQQRERVSALVADYKTKISLLEKDAEVHSERKEQLETALREYQKGKEEELKLVHETQMSIEQMNGAILDKQSQMDDNRQKMADCRTAIEAILQSKSGENQEIQNLREESKSVTQTVFSLQEECTRLEGRLTRTQEDLDRAVSEMWEEYELTISDALGMRNQELNIAEAQKRAGKIRSEMRGMGNINVDAIEEYKTVKERYDFLSGQRDDLEEAKTNLTKIIRDLTGAMKSQFEEKFQVIRTEFNQVFRELFGGGKADLIISDESDILMSGIEIEVQPPGKKLQNLSLLSGGERAFTAIALLFAILRVRPTPFCILDEIEAALDDVNVYRFAEYLRRYSDKTQFIIITHRRGTMEAANILYGITMQEKGVSKLLAMNLDEVEQ